MISLLPALNFPKITIMGKSGHSELDAKAVELALHRFKFKAAEIEGKPADTVLYLNVIWPDYSP